ncbi:PREDICTED: uncharacterized protein LOC105459088 [Wasmannia auropunctata]|uniref:uncharacterized protein LOC105459088 n=1 Tax=Wasmannia auropunctata TaxID=64793 RepID=UPI0005EED7A4|nr:PREDICTED: uncharacterized protein LOC105459088 [Wasmannia auropunctata]
MRITVALSFLAALCTVGAIPTSTDLEILRLRVRDMKWNVETVIRQLQLLRVQTEDDTLRQVSLKWDEEQDSHRTYKTLLLSGIRSEIDAAKAEGRNVDSCYQEAIDGIENNEKVAYDDASKCEDAARNSIHNNLGFIDSLILTGNTLSMECDNIFLNCHDSDIYRMQSCIIGELARAEGALRTLEGDSINAEITIAPVSKNVIMQAGNCIKQAYSITYSAGVMIRMRVTQCIQLQTTTTTNLAPEIP